MKTCRLLFVFLVAVLVSVISLCAQERWSADKAKDWYAKQQWLVGANYVPSDAINQLEMFQAATWNPALNDKELGWAEGIGMNTMRVFLHDQLWAQDPEGFKKRLNEFLAICAKHHIKPMLVLFDSVWDPEPKLGPQHPPIPGVHNSGWVQSPGRKGLTDPAYEPKLEAYVKGVVGAFAKDERILAWDIWNEPDNDTPQYGVIANKTARIDYYLPKAFAWARSEHPVQPLTSGVWHDDWNRAKLKSTAKIQIEESDVISFHNYGWPEEFEAKIKELQQYGRPIICSEYMARGAGSTFDNSLPIAKQYHVGAVNWGLVDGKTQTRYPWDSWKKPYVMDQPVLWFHDVFHADGTPYRQHEAELIRQLTGRGMQ